MDHVRTPFRLVRANLRTHFVMCAIVYGMLLVGMAAGLLFPDLHAAQLAEQDANGTTGLVTSLLDNVWLFSLVIFAVNVFAAAVATIVLPSLIVPFSGIATFAFSAFVIGVTLAPVDKTAAVVLIPHSLTILIELQAYALVMLGAFLLGRAWLRPGTVDAPNRRTGYLRGLRQFGWVCLPALVLLVVGAIYEAFSLTQIVPRLLAG